MADTTQTVEAKDEPLRGGIDIERYGEVMAHLRHFGKTHHPEVLERLGLDEDRWEEALFGFTALLVEESEREEEALSRRFGERFAKTKTKLVKEKPAIASLGSLRHEKPVEAPPVITTTQSAPMPIMPITPVPVSPQEIPVPISQRVQSVVLGGTSPWAHNSGAPMMAAPMVAAPMMAAPLPPASPVIAEPIRELHSIVPAGMRHFQGIQGTQGPSVTAATQPALPFASNAAFPELEPEAAYRRAKEHADVTEPIRLETTSPSGHAGGETRDISSIVASVMAQSKATPFPQRKPSAPTAPAPVPIVPIVPIVPSASTAPAPVPIVPSAPVVVPAPVVVLAPVSPEPISLTLEQYASLCVEITIAPANRREIAARYGLSEEHAARVDTFWRARIASDPEIDKNFRWAYHSYQQWLAGRA